MSEIDMLRLLINERLTAAAEEIFSVFGRAISELEEKLSLKSLEVERQRRLLELSVTPCVKIEPTDLPLIQESSSTVYSLSEVPGELEHVKEELEEETWSAEAQGEATADADHALTSDQHPEEPNLPALTMHEQQHDTPNGLDCEPGTSSASTGAHTMPPLPLPSGPAPTTFASKFRTPRPGLPASPPYVCSVCGKGFSQRMYWAAHVRLHRGSLRDKSFRVGDNKSFRCDICGKWLTRLDGLEKHLRVHTGEKPYGCHLCGKRFSDNSNYKRHIRRHGTDGDGAIADTSSTDMLGVLQDTP